MIYNLKNIKFFIFIIIFIYSIEASNQCDYLISFSAISNSSKVILYQNQYSQTTYAGTFSNLTLSQYFSITFSGWKVNSSQAILLTILYNGNNMKHLKVENQKILTQQYNSISYSSVLYLAFKAQIPFLSIKFQTTYNEGDFNIYAYKIGWINYTSQLCIYQCFNSLKQSSNAYSSTIIGSYQCDYGITIDSSNKINNSNYDYVWFLVGFFTFFLIFMLSPYLVYFCCCKKTKMIGLQQPSNEQIIQKQKNQINSDISSFKDFLFQTSPQKNKIEMIKLNQQNSLMRLQSQNKMIKQEQNTNINTNIIVDQNAKNNQTVQQSYQNEDKLNKQVLNTKQQYHKSFYVEDSNINFENKKQNQEENVSHLNIQFIENISISPNFFQNQKNVCQICLKNNSSLQLCCLHKFHIQCIKSFRLENQIFLCPICKKNQQTSKIKVNQEYKVIQVNKKQLKIEEL